MKVLIRNSLTGLYVADRTKIPLPAPGELPWTDTTEKARDFKLIDRAVDCIAVWKLENVQIAFAFDTSTTRGITMVSLEKVAVDVFAR